MAVDAMRFSSTCQPNLIRIHAELLFDLILPCIAPLMSREQVLLNSAIIFVNPIWCYQGVLLRQAGVYCIGSERDELIVDTIGRMYMDALTVVPATRSWRRTCHVKHHIHALAISGRQWQGAVDGWSREESMEFLQPALPSRKDFFHARRLRMQR